MLRPDQPAPLRVRRRRALRAGDTEQLRPLQLQFGDGQLPDDLRRPLRLRAAILVQWRGLPADLSREISASAAPTAEQLAK
jgi:hypothetical protein